MTTHYNQCSKRVQSPGDYTAHQCTRKGVVVFEGWYYCQQHNPPKVSAESEARHQASKEKWATEARNERERQHRIDCYPDLLAALERLMGLYYHCDYAEEPDPEVCPAAIEGNEHFLGEPCHWGEARAAIAKATSPQAR